MNLSMRHLKLPTLLLAAWMLLGAALEASVSSRLSSRFLARGEKAVLEVAFIGKRPTAFPEIPPVEGLKISPTGNGPQTQLVPGRRVEHIFTYIVSSYEVGSHSIPPMRRSAGNLPR